MKKRKRGRPKSANPMIHTAVVLPVWLHAMLRQSGNESGRGLSGEIRQRLLESYYDLGRPRLKIPSLPSR